MAALAPLAWPRRRATLPAVHPDTFGTQRDRVSMPIDPTLDSAIKNATHAPDKDIAAILLSVAGGIDTVLTRSRCACSHLTRNMM